MDRHEQRRQDVEKSASARLPGDLFRLDSKALNKAAGLGFLPMEEGWIAGGIIAKAVMARMRSKLPEFEVKSCPELSPDRNRVPSEWFSLVDPSLPVKALIRLRTDLVKRGLLT